MYKTNFQSENLSVIISNNFLPGINEKWTDIYIFATLKTTSSMNLPNQSIGIPAKVHSPHKNMETLEKKTYSIIEKSD